MPRAKRKTKRGKGSKQLPSPSRDKMVKKPLSMK
jgi:hypothetical protein